MECLSDHGWVNKPNPPRYLTSGSLPIRFYLVKPTVDSLLSTAATYLPQGYCFSGDAVALSLGPIHV